LLPRSPGVEAAYFLQIWIHPEKRGIAPGYEQRSFEAHDLRDRLRLVASRHGRDGSVTLHQDAALYVTKLSAGGSVGHAVAPGRHAWIQVASGKVTLNGLELGEGDGAAVSDEVRLELRAIEDAEVLVFDLV
jgi:hypothetical protein